MGLLDRYLKRFSFVVIVFLIFPSSIVSIQTINFQVNSNSVDDRYWTYSLQQLDGWTQNYGSAQSIGIKENSLYLTGGNKELFIVNISDPNNHSTLGSYHNNTQVQKSILVGNHLFVALEENSIDIIDIENESYPTQIGSYQSEGEIRDIHILDSILYIAKGESGVEITDISNASDVTYLTTIDSGGFAKRITKNNDFLYIADGTNGLEIYNLTDYNNPIRTGTYSDGNDCFDVVISNDFAFILDDSDFMKILDISNKTDIQKINEYPINNPTNIIVKDNFTFITQYEKISVVNYTDPDNLVLISNYNTTSEIISMEICDDVIYLSCEEGIELIQINSNKSLNQISRFGFEEVTEIIYSENIIFANMGHEGITIINASEPTALQKKSTYQTNGKIVDMCKSENILFIVIENIGIEIIDIQNIENPTKVGEYQTEGEIKSLCIRDNYLFIASHLGGEHEIGEVLALDISNLTLLQEIDRYEGHFSQYTKVVIYEDVIFAIDNSGYLIMFDYSRFIDPNEEPRNIYRIEGRGYSDVVARGDMVYTCLNGDLKSFNIANLNNIVEVSCITEGSYYNLDLVGDNIYTKGRDTICIFEIIGDKLYSRMTAEINNSVLKDIAVEENRICVSNIGIGDNILLFNHTLPPIEEGNSIWPYIVFPICGTIVIVTIVFVTMKARQKKRKRMPKEEEREIDEKLN